MAEYIVKETGYPGVVRQEVVGELVRCKDCIHYEIAQLKSDYTEDRRHKPSVCTRGYARYRKPDWYCADGERREDGSD